MWMMGYSDGGDLNVSDSFNSRKLRPLIPRPSPAASTNHTSTTNTPCLSRIHGTDLLALNHHLVSTMADQSKREFTAQQVVVSSRWNPTPEQLQTLEELYRQGTRTPSAEQIQHITAQLRRYGKIEGKNVFYWFQNHKARERQKRRRKLESAPDEPYRDFESTERKESGANRTVFDGVEQTKNWETPTNYSTISEAEKTVSTQRASAAKAALIPECRTDGWVQFDGRELQHRRSLVERNATWRMMHLPCSPPTHLVNSTCSAVTITTEAAMDPKHVKSTYHRQDLNIFLSPYTQLGDHDHPHLVSGGQEAAGCGDSQTLQLFPLRSGDGEENDTEKEMMGKTSMNSNFTPYQFFEFLPLKN